MVGFVVLTLYKLTPLADPAAVRAGLHAVCAAQGILGTLIVAPEGVNGTLAGTRHAIDRLRSWFAADSRFRGMEAKESAAAAAPFHRLKVVRKPEVVPLRSPLVAPDEQTGTHVAAGEWNRMLRDPDVQVLDCRNEFEIDVGTFPGAINPRMRSFTEFPDFVARHLDPARDRTVAMFCTGGIRCEKASSLLLRLGFARVYQLRGGILRYLEVVPGDASLWRGECFVFDRRVSVVHGLRPGTYDECHGCKSPVSAADRNAPEYEEHVSCPRCHAALTAVRRANLLERARQMRLAATRGERHLARRQESASSPGDA